MSPAAACPATCRGCCRRRWARGCDPSAWPMPSVMRLLGELGGIEDDELRATFNGGLGMVLVVPAASGARTVALAAARGIDAWVVGEVVDAGALGGARYAETAA